MKPLSVSSLNIQIKSVLETTFFNVYVEGEISNLTHHSSGHIYFSLKDENSVISCVMFKGNAKSLKFRLEVGMKIVVSGSLTLFVPRGNYQIQCSKIDPSGVGELALAYEQLKKELTTLGYFDESRKKQLPKFPKHLVIITSPTGAAIEDMKRIANNRWQLTKITLIPTLVQGQGAKEDISNSVKFADSLNADIIIVGRGGGSIEDLWAFNEKVVADAIFNAKTPIISAVGHESDFVISDFVADVRASTPSNAIEISLPNLNDIYQYIDTLKDSFYNYHRNLLDKKQTQLTRVVELFKYNSYEKRFSEVSSNIMKLKNDMNFYMKNIIERKQKDIDTYKNYYLTNEPSKKDKKGFVQITKNNDIISINDLEKDDNITLESSQRIAKAKIISITNI